MRCIVCLEEKKKEELDFTYNDVPICSDLGCDFFKTWELDRIISYQENDLARNKERLISLHKEWKFGSGYWDEEEYEYYEREDEEISRDIRDTEEKIPILEELIKSLKQHPNVRLKYLLK
ncbi:hypothetical protein BC2926_38790 [Bacillus cereus]|nr:hypothetical protein BC2926_38790 [Bacillus cereus]